MCYKAQTVLLLFLQNIVIVSICQTKYCQIYKISVFSIMIYNLSELNFNILDKCHIFVSVLGEGQGAFSLDMLFCRDDLYLTI